MNNISTNPNADLSQTEIALPPAAELPAPFSPSIPLPNWLLAIALLSVISQRLYQTSRVILYIVRMWKKPPADKTQ